MNWEWRIKNCHADLFVTNVTDFFRAKIVKPWTNPCGEKNELPQFSDEILAMTDDVKKKRFSAQGREWHN